MRRAILTTFLAVVSTSALAGWEAVNSDDTTTAYADPATIREAGNFMNIWVLSDYKTVRVPPGGKRYMYASSKAHNEYDCKTQRARVLSFSWFSRNMGEGKIVYNTAKPGRWEPVAPDTIVGNLWQFACGKRQVVEYH